MPLFISPTSIKLFRILKGHFNLKVAVFCLLCHVFNSWWLTEFYIYRDFANIINELVFIMRTQVRNCGFNVPKQYKRCLR